MPSHPAKMPRCHARVPPPELSLCLQATTVRTETKNKKQKTKASFSLRPSQGSYHTIDQGPGQQDPGHQPPFSSREICAHAYAELAHYRARERNEHLGFDTDDSGPLGACSRHDTRPIETNSSLPFSPRPFTQTFNDPVSTSAMPTSGTWGTRRAPLSHPRPVRQSRRSSNPGSDERACC